MAQAVLNLRLPEDLKKQAQEKAQAEGESLSVIIRQLLREWSKA